jgi:hypothetical protein
MLFHKKEHVYIKIIADCSPNHTTYKHAVCARGKKTADFSNFRLGVL